MRISGAIKRLAELSIKYGDIRVGFTGHYGEFYELGEDDVNTVIVYKDERSQRLQRFEKVITMEMPCIGEEPD